MGEDGDQHLPVCVVEAPPGEARQRMCVNTLLIINLIFVSPGMCGTAPTWGVKTRDFHIEEMLFLCFISNF